MKIWVDADACPVVVKDILYKAAVRAKLQLILVANRRFKIPISKFIEFKQVAAGLDVADREIAKNVKAGDLVITADIPLAALVVERGALAINPRGEIYSPENISERLSARDFMDTLRSSGIETGGPSAISKRDIQLFANSLDQTIAKNKKSA